MFRLDKSVGKGHSHKKIHRESDYWKTKTVNERLAAAMYLNSIAYHFDINNPPRMDKTVFSFRKHEE